MSSCNCSYPQCSRLGYCILKTPSISYFGNSPSIFKERLGVNLYTLDLNKMIFPMFHPDWVETKPKKKGFRKRKL